MHAQLDYWITVYADRMRCVLHLVLTQKNLIHLVVEFSQDVSICMLKESFEF